MERERIPKVIHYCWFGRKRMPKLTKKCIESWKKNLPDYKLILWNEDNFDISINPFMKQAYDSHKFAFVSDFLRLYVLYKYGGIYMDTDVEVIKNLDPFLTKTAFSGFENINFIPTGIMASEKNHPWVKVLLDYYEDKFFINDDGSYNNRPNTEIITELSKQLGLKLDNTYQVLNGGIHIYPNDYFCPKSIYGGINLTQNTYTIHHFVGSWFSPRKRVIFYFKKYFFIPLVGEKNYWRLRNMIKK